MQGRLTGRSLSVHIQTVCGHCGRPMELIAGSDGDVSVIEGGAAPLVSMPDVDWADFTEPNITHRY